MEKGWDARGLLEPLWAAVGGRDGLAAATGIQPATLSGYNTGRLPLGIVNARKIAEALGVSVLELGAPAEEGDARGQLILDRLAAAEAQLGKLGPDLLRLGRRVAALERRVPPSTQPGRAKTS